MVQHVFRIHGLRMDMVSDRGPPFSSWKVFCTLIGSSSSLSSGFHPQSNCQSERANQALVCLVSANPTTWSQQLVWVEYARNTLPCSATGLLPFECSLWCQPPLFPEQEEEVGTPSVQMFIHRCHTWRTVFTFSACPDPEPACLPSCTFAPHI